MVFREKSLTCFDCGANFTFTAEEQEFFASKGFTNEPKRCPSCLRQEKRNVMEPEVVAGHSGKCSRQHVLSVARIPRYHSSPAATNQCIAAIATVKSG